MKKFQNTSSAQLWHLIGGISPDARGVGKVDAPAEEVKGHRRAVAVPVRASWNANTGSWKVSWPAVTGSLLCLKDGLGPI